MSPNLHEIPLQGSRIRVLHVDDDSSVLELASAFLDRELDSVSVTTLTDPTEVPERLDAEPFDCVISDYDMPEQDGLELFEVIRENHPLVPFVLYTGKGSEQIASQAVNAGVTGYFQKGGPDQLRRLANEVKQAAADYQTKIEANRYSTVLSALEYPIYVVDETGVFSFVNDAFLKMTGYDREEIIGSPTDIIKDDDAVAEAGRQLGEILSDKGPDIAQFPVDIVAKNGDRIPCRDHMGVLPYEGEEFRGSVGILRDITEERRRAAELERKTRAMDEAPIGITITDPELDDNPMIYVNDHFVEMTGYPRSEAVGRNCRFLQGDGTRSDAVDELREAIESGRATSVDLRNYTRAGELFWNRVTIKPLRDDSGAITNWLGFQEDVTDRKQHERELERQNERLERFASIVSHDLRSPMNVVSGRIELARSETDSDKDLDAALEALGRMETIVEDTLTLARQGDAVGDFEAVSLKSAAETAWRTTETEDATLETIIDAEIHADGDRLETLLQNLFGNAAGHGGADVTVRLGATDDDDGFYVSDDGAGIPADQRDSIFEPGHTTAEDGTGFGLAIVKEVAEAHGWSIEVTESETGGARFEITGVSVLAGA